MRDLLKLYNFRQQRHQLKAAQRDHAAGQEIVALVPLLERRSRALCHVRDVVRVLLGLPPDARHRALPLFPDEAPTLPPLTAADQRQLLQQEGTPDAATRAAGAYVTGFVQVYGLTRPELVQELARHALQLAEPDRRAGGGRFLLALLALVVL